MRLKAIVAILLVSITMSLTSCTKVNYNKNLGNNTESGNVLVNSNLMSLINSLGPGYEFIPLEYKNGEVSGVISPEKIDRYFIEYSNNTTSISPLAFTEYKLDTRNLNDSFLEETGNVLRKSQLSGYEVNSENPLDIVVKDLMRQKENRYSLKGSNNFRVEKSKTAGSYQFDSQGKPYKVNPNEVIEIYCENDERINVGYSGGTVVGKDKRYVYFTYGFGKFNENISKLEEIVYVLYDSQSEQFYELEVNDIKDYWGEEGCFFEVASELYYIKATGEIKKATLNNGEIELEDFYDFELKEDERIAISYGYNSNFTTDTTIMLELGKALPNGGASYGNVTGLDFIEKIKREYPIPLKSNAFISKILGEDDLMIVGEWGEKSYVRVWIAKDKGSDYEKLVQIDEYSMRGTDISNATIEDILYDSETKSFFIKRKIKIDKKQTYQYEVVFLD